MKNGSKTPAAQYVRMSTEDQQYSIENQKVAIKNYADRSGYEVVATYADSGKSGVSVKNRLGLRSLLQDVMNGAADFKVILVYDVSRWGRFQNVDEGAHYEFLCTNAGIPVRYCAEQFENDGSMPSSFMKALKRTMAGEYSRELGNKVYQGQRNLAQMGFRMASTPAYGVRRMLISSDGRRKQILKFHERKSIESDRIILVPGPRKEVECIRKIFLMGTLKRNTPRRIAAELERQGFKYAAQKPWTEQRVFHILKNPVYTGCNVFGKTTSRLDGPVSKTAPENWIVKPMAFEGIVEQSIFDKVQRAIRHRRTAKRPDEYLLRGMRRVLEREGKLTQDLLKGRHIFDHRTYCKRFGSVMTAYRLVGYTPSERSVKTVEGFAKKKRLRTALLLALKERFPSQLRIMRLPGQFHAQVVELDEQTKVAIHIGKPLKSLQNGEPGWLIRYRSVERGLPALLCTVNPSVTKLLHYYVVPKFGDGKATYVTLREKRGVLAMARKIELDQFYQVVNEIPKWQERDQSTTVGDVVFTTKSSTIKIGDKDVILSQSEAAMFKLLVLHAGEIVSREQLCHPACGIDLRYLTAHMYYFRKRLGRKLGSRIQTVVGRGYVYVPPDATFQKQFAFRLNEQTLRAAMLQVPGPLTADKRKGK